MTDEIQLYKEFIDYNLFDNGRHIGQCSLGVKEGFVATRGKEQTYPDSWFIKDTEALKPSLEIIGYETAHHVREGYGRKGLQKIYELSKELGCEGRMEALSAYGAGTFYEHCGMEGINKGEDGLKYFEPSQQNLSKLYKNPSENNGLTFEKVENRNSGVELAFDEDMGTFITITSSQSNPEVSFLNNNQKEFELDQPSGKQPKLTINFEKGEIEYEDKEFQKKKIGRLRENMKNRDYLKDKETTAKQGLEEIGLEGKIGKTADITSGKVSEKHKKTADSQVEDLKPLMIKRLKTISK